ncbi:5-formyltetrahydrofolate cyclo-ligase [Spirosoma sp. BT702]|uniref:5-formyltetrahydrofolate cyclo-ligase n=1 Tax=Spirosoma profusum TaxID=2771354 RepID=A0A926XZ46_9BACT|nr:5-formyltetrahydrofolate cyclo-ligase [Spirosoma profusum]MBD2703599.1 5-formyltetrahydrofolate cyclo-ligase [Spirosoma profusum]
MHKADLRKIFLAKRKSLSADEIQQRSEQLARLFFDFLDKSRLSDRSLLLHIFLPIERQNELDTWLIINKVWHNYPLVNVAVSITDTTTNLLTHYPLKADTPLQENRWGIPEPVQSIEPTIPSSQFDVVLVPLLCFDKRGHRVGYGKGFYDRYLADCRPDCLKIGLSLFDPVDPIDDILQTDVALDVVISSNEIFIF